MSFSSSSSSLYFVLNRQQPALRTRLISAKAPEDRGKKTNTLVERACGEAVLREGAFGEGKPTNTLV